MTIEIYLDKYKAIVDGYRIIINDRIKKITNDDIEKLINFTINWKEDYINSNVFEGETYYIKVEDKVYTFKNKYPENIYLLQEFLGEIYDNR